MGKITYFSVFPLFGGTYNLSNDFILSYFFNGKQNLVKVFCGQNPISSTLFRDPTLEIYFGRGKL